MEKRKGSGKGNAGWLGFASRRLSGMYLDSPSPKVGRYKWSRGRKRDECSGLRAEWDVLYTAVYGIYIDEAATQGKRLSIYTALHSEIE
jgi:hypothetical protein